jgi:hypothetical protein
VLKLAGMELSSCQSVISECVPGFGKAGWPGDEARLTLWDPADCAWLSRKVGAPSASGRSAGFTVRRIIGQGRIARSSTSGNKGRARAGYFGLTAGKIF